MKIDLPVLFINFKTYEQSTGKNAVSLAKVAEAAAKEANASVVLVVQATDIRVVSQAVSLPVFAQHIDPIEFGSGTGHVLPEAVVEAGAVGTILNHAENKRPNDFLEKAIVRAKSVGLIVMACAETVARVKEISSFSATPNFVAVEPPELIGGDISVSTAKPELITGSVKAVKDIAPEVEVITGAGIKNSADVRKAIELGTKGVFVASGIVKASDQSQAIKSILEGLVE